MELTRTATSFLYYTLGENGATKTEHLIEKKRKKIPHVAAKSWASIQKNSTRRKWCINRLDSIVGWKNSHCGYHSCLWDVNSCSSEKPTSSGTITISNWCASTTESTTSTDIYTTCANTNASATSVETPTTDSAESVYFKFGYIYIFWCFGGMKQKEVYVICIIIETKIYSFLLMAIENNILLVYFYRIIYCKKYDTTWLLYWDLS